MGREIDRRAREGGHERCERVGDADVAFEFTVGEAAERNVRELLEAGVAVVSGTTGWTPSDALCRVAEAAPRGAVIAPNFSVGVNLFFRIAAAAATLLGAAGRHQPYVLEAHHAGKRDVPSGTARRLAQIVVGADPRLESVQEGHPDGPLPPGTLQVVGLRVGHEPGTHVVGFDGAEDAITLTHRARGRGTFAVGAVLAAQWLLASGRPGIHGFEVVLNDLLTHAGAGDGERR